MDHIVHRVLRFDRFALDLVRGCLRADDQDIDLRPKAFEVLCYLAENAGRLVPKKELVSAKFGVLAEINGQLHRSGTTGSGTWRDSLGCNGTWTASKE